MGFANRRYEPEQIELRILMRKSALLLTLAVCIAVQAQDLKPIQLPAPQTDGGRPLMQVLKERKTQREFGPEKLPMQVLANLLWAEFGINLPDGRRTAPSAMNWQEIDIYVAMGDGLFLCNAKSNRLEAILAHDVRAATGTQDFVATAPVDLVYVADLSKTGQAGVWQNSSLPPTQVSSARMSTYSVLQKGWQRSFEVLWIVSRWPRS